MTTTNTLLEEALGKVDAEVSLKITNTELDSLNPADHLDEAFDALIENGESDFKPTEDKDLESLFFFNQDHLDNIPQSVLDSYNPDNTESNNKEHFATKTPVLGESVLSVNYLIGEATDITTMPTEDEDDDSDLDPGLEAEILSAMNDEDA